MSFSFSRGLSEEFVGLFWNILFHLRYSPENAAILLVCVSPHSPSLGQLPLPGRSISRNILVMVWCESDSFTSQWIGPLHSRDAGLQVLRRTCRKGPGPGGLSTRTLYFSSSSCFSFSGLSHPASLLQPTSGGCTHFSSSCSS